MSEEKRTLDEILRDVNAPSIRYNTLEGKESLIWDSRTQRWKIQRRRKRLKKSEEDCDGR